jgi:hypothetical protein
LDEKLWRHRHSKALLEFWINYRNLLLFCFLK